MRAGILARAPQARVTCIDLSPRMLERLRERYSGYRDQLTLIPGSYLDLPLGQGLYDYALSVMTVHHLTPEVKVELYRRIRAALKPGGAYIEGDWYVSPEKEREYRAAHDRRLQELGAVAVGRYHLDIPLSLETQFRLLREAGFAGVERAWLEGEDGVLVARTLAP